MPGIDTVEMTEEHRQYLNALRESGVVNMFGAASYLEEEFGLDRKEAKAVLIQWMESFEG